MIDRAAVIAEIRRLTRGNWILEEIDEAFGYENCSDAELAGLLDELRKGHAKDDQLGTAAR